MRQLAVLGCVSVLAGLAGCQQGRFHDYATFGEAVPAAEAVPLAQVVSHLDQYEGKTVNVTATIAEVCANRGCWMTLNDGPHQVRVRFTASERCTDGFLVPRNASGHQAYVRGVVQRDTISQDEARHYAEDAGKSSDEIARIVGDQQGLTMLASGVMISDRDTLDPPVE